MSEQLTIEELLSMYSYLIYILERMRKDFLEARRRLYQGLSRDDLVERAMIAGTFRVPDTEPEIITRSDKLCAVAETKIAIGAVKKGPMTIAEYYSRNHNDRSSQLYRCCHETDERRYQELRSAHVTWFSPK